MLNLPRFKTMNNTDTVHSFFTAFGRLDFKMMNAYYSDDVLFSDPLFGMLSGDQVKNKWEFVCTNVEDFHLQIKNIEEQDQEYVTCSWHTTYFSLVSRSLVSLEVKSYMRLAEGKIIEHSDAFRPQRWIRQTYGIRGWLFGWIGFFRTGIQRKLLQQLDAFSRSKKFFASNSLRKHISDSFDQ